MSSSKGSSPWISPAETTSPEAVAFHHGSDDSDKQIVDSSHEHGLFAVVSDNGPQQNSREAPLIPTTATEHHEYYGAGAGTAPIKKDDVQVSQVDEKEALTDDDSSIPRSARRKWIILAAILVLLAGLAVGLGVGLTRPKDTASSIPVASNSSDSTTSSTTVAKEASLQANSSLAAVETELGDRFVFFQDEDDSIRWAVFSNSTLKWTSMYYLNNSIKARSNTPLAAYVQPGANVNIQSLIELVYIADNSSIIEVEIASDKSIKTSIAKDSRPLTAAADAEHLSISAAMRPGANDTLDIFMMFRTPSMIGIWQREVDRTDWTFGSPWQDITSDLTDSLPNGNLCEPFHGNAYFSTTASDGQPDTLAQFVISSCSQATPKVLSAVWNRLNNNFTTVSWSTYSFDITTTTSKVQNNPAITQSDWIVVQGSSQWYFVSNGALSAFSFESTTLPQPIADGKFPYPHLSTLKWAWGVKSAYIYHQLDGMNFAEQVYDSGTKKWTSTTVDVSKVALAS